MKRIQRYVLGLVAVLALAGCSSHRHHGMAGEGKGGCLLAERAAGHGRIDRSHRQGSGEGRAGQICRDDIVAELKTGREQDRAGHRRMYELNANYAATPEEFTKILDEANNQRMQSAAKILWLRFKMKDL